MPGEQRAGIVFTLRGNIRMGHHVFRFDVIAGNNVFGEGNKRRDLRRFKRGEDFLAVRLLPATVFQLNTNRGIVDAIRSAPETDPRVPG
ncbi:hypothetical protein D3C71_1890150 [compost metagenome]